MTYCFENVSVQSEKKLIAISVVLLEAIHYFRLLAAFLEASARGKITFIHQDSSNAAINSPK